jgi:hypothetical protein
MGCSWSRDIRKIAPNWSDEYNLTVKVGEHVFYKPAAGKAK